MKDFVGRGFTFPVGVDRTGRVDLVGGEANVERAMRLVLGTTFGERPMRPEFGCGIHDLVYSAISPALLSEIRINVEASLRRWETRADVLSIDVTPDESAAMVEILITYRLKGDYDPRNLLVPFYLIPSEESL